MSICLKAIDRNVMIYLEKPIMIHSRSQEYCHVIHNYISVSKEEKRGEWLLDSLLILTAMLYPFGYSTFISTVLPKHIFNIAQPTWNVRTLSLGVTTPGFMSYSSIC